MSQLIGNFFGLYLAGQRVALAQSKSAKIATKVEPITTDDSWGWEEVLPSDHNFNATVDGIICAFPDNLLQFPENLNTSPWQWDTSVLVDPDFSEDINGQLRGNKIAFNTGTFVKQVIPNHQFDKNWYSLYAKGSGSISIKIEDENAHIATKIIALTNEWTRYWVYISNFKAGDDCTISINDISSTDCQICNTMLNTGELLLDYKGSTYTVSKLIAAQTAKTKLQLRWSTDLDNDSQIQIDVYVSDFQLKTKNTTVSGFSCTLNGTKAAQVTTI